MSKTKFEFGPEHLYHTNGFGDFYIVCRSDKKDAYNSPFYRIKFINTGTEIEVRGSRIKSGQIKDPYAISVLGVACKGITPPVNEGIPKYAYAIWGGILTRIFVTNSYSYNIYGGAGVSISKEWLCFENFLADLPSLPGYDLWVNDHTKYDLDKDKLQQHLPINQRIYSKETCCFISKSENRVLNTKSINYSSKYNGVIYDKSRKKFKSSIKNNRINYMLGRFKNEEAAAVVFNHFAKPLNRVLNNNVTMSYLDALEYRSGSNRFVMYKVVRDDIIDPWEANYINKTTNAGYKEDNI